MQTPAKKSYTVTGGPKGPPILGTIGAVIRDPLSFFVENSLRYGDIIPFNDLGKRIIQVNHPELVKYVLIENYKNYHKSESYIRFESAIGRGLLTSNGAKWKQDRQKIQPMFRREQIEGYYFDVISEVSEKYKQRWFALTEKGKAEIDLTREMTVITTEIILKLIFGRDNLDEDAITTLHHSYSVFMEYLKVPRLLSRVDLSKLFHTPGYLKFKKALARVDAIIARLLAEHRKGQRPDKYNMLVLLSEAQKQDPDHFSELDIMEHSRTMVFAGFETTSILMQWMWYALDGRPDVENKLRGEITEQAPCTAARDSSGLTHEAINKMDYLSATFKETMRLYPPIWITSREPVEKDSLGDFEVEPGNIILLPQIIMQRHPRWWNEPNAFIPERFSPENEAGIDAGLYFPFSHGARKCSGYKLAEMEAKIIFSKLLPLFRVKALNSLGNNFDPGITLKFKRPLLAEITRV
jgi:cytochrome P450